MNIAQKLYESGLITYMRTDSLFISEEFEHKLERECKHIFITEREDGPYGELWDTCKLCGYTKRH